MSLGFLRKVVLSAIMNTVLLQRTSFSIQAVLTEQSSMDSFISVYNHGASQSDFIPILIEEKRDWDQRKLN